MPRKICVVVTGRPSYPRIKTALAAICAHPDLELQLVVAASALLDRYGNAVRNIVQDGFQITAQVYMVLEGENPTTMAKTTGLGLIELATVFDNLKPDAVVTIADRYETLATAIAASYMNLPVVHIQGGEVTGSIDEKVRHAVTKLSNLHFVTTREAARRVVQMGEDPATVFVTGCPSIDLAAQVVGSGNGDLGFDPLGKYGGVGVPLDLSRDFLIVLQHPVTTEYDAARAHVTETLYAVREIGLPTIWFWPNVDAGSDGTSKGIRAFRELQDASNFHFLKHMAPEDFLRLLLKCGCVVGNSSVGIRECSYLGVPVVNIGSRQQGRERGANVVEADYDRCSIEPAVRRQLAAGRYASEALYGDGKAGKRVADLLATCDLRIEKRLSY